MHTWAPIFSGIVESSLWDLDDYICKVFITMLAVKDADHVVRKNTYQIGFLSRKGQELAEQAIAVLCAPDPHRKDQPYEGRRLQRVEDGWLILNGQFYQDLMRKTSRAVYQARWQREYRARKKSERNLKDSEAQANGYIPPSDDL